MNTGRPVQRAPLFSLASLLVSYPGDDFLERAALLCETLAKASALPTELRAQILTLQDAALLDERRAQYLAAFERAGAPLRETSYGRMLGPGIGNALAEIAAYYSAFGVQCSSETADHLGVELEFYALLLVKEDYLEEQSDAEGVAIVRDARKSFLADHLAPLALAAGKAHTSELFAPTIAYVAALVAEECTKLGISATLLEITPAVGPSREGDDAPMACGGVHLPVVS